MYLFAKHLMSIWFLFILLSGCAINSKLILANETNKEIFIISIYSKVKLDSINSGEQKEVPFNFDCFRIKTAEKKLFEYKFPHHLKNEYLKPRLFDTLLKGKYTKNHELLIINFNKNSTLLLAPSYCDSISNYN